jgi:hypothetical protein
MVRFGSGRILITLTDSTDTASVYYLSTKDSTLQTSDGVRVGMTVEQLNARIGPLEYAEGECGLYTYSKRRPYLGIGLTLPADSADCGNLAPKPPALPRGSVIWKIFLHHAT